MQLIRSKARLLRVGRCDGQFPGTDGRSDNLARLASDAGQTNTERRLVQNPLVHFAFAADNGLAETEIRIDDHLAKLAVDGIHTESDAGNLRRDHLLNYNRHRGP